MHSIHQKKLKIIDFAKLRHFSYIHLLSENNHNKIYPDIYIKVEQAATKYG